MDKLTKHQQALTAILSRIAAIPYAKKDGLIKELVTDFVHHHYQVLATGWQGSEFVHSILLHLDIKADGKIWIQQNWTEFLIADELIDRGIDKSDIVLGFIPPNERKYTGFAEC